MPVYGIGELQLLKVEFDFVVVDKTMKFPALYFFQYQVAVRTESYWRSS